VLLLIVEPAFGGHDAVLELSPLGLFAHCGDHVEHARDETIVGRGGERLMQRGVPQLELIERRGVLRFLDAELHALEIGRRRIGDDELGERRLDPQPRLHELGGARMLETLGGKGPRSGVRRTREESTAAHVTGDRPFRLELRKSPPHRVPWH
jgi:hypothetical protein